MIRLKDIRCTSFAVALWTLAVAALFSCSGPAPKPPVAQIIPHVDTTLGDVRVDNYFWLRNRDDSAVTAYLEAENAYTAAVMKHTETFQKKLYDEMLGRIKETDLTVPYREDSFYYYMRMEEGKQYSIQCRKKGSLDAPEEILLDINPMAVGHDYFELGTFSVSPDHRLLAYSVDTAGSEVFTLYVKDLTTGAMLSDTIPNTSYTVHWAADNSTLFYTTLDEIVRPDKLFRHTLGQPIATDVLVYQEPDEAYSVYIDRSKSKKYIFIALGSNSETEIRYLEADNPTGTFKLFLPRQSEVKYFIDHQGDYFYIHTNEGAENFRLFKTPISDPSRKSWVEIIPNRDSVYLEGIEVFRDFLVVYERENGLRKIRVDNLIDNTSHFVDFPEPIYIFWPTNNIDYNTDSLRFAYMSLVTPQTVYDYNMTTKALVLKRQYEVLGGYDKANYTSERLFATAPDGIKVPISLVYRKGMTKDGSHPLLLKGYGSYGSSTEPTFNSDRLSLLDRGFIYALAHVRGGSEMGRWWYEQGRLLNKKNTFTDFIACADYLVQEKYTSPDKLVASGASAGGLVMGAIANMRPDLFKVIIADVPFVDVVNTMLDPTIPLTVTEYTEWGNPNEKEYYDYIKSYAPYENVEAKSYPNILVTAGLNDPRVQYWEPAKWTAKMRAMKTDTNRLLLKTNMGAGHGGASGRYDYLKETALEYAFILDVLGINK